MKTDHPTEKDASHASALTEGSAQGESQLSAGVREGDALAEIERLRLHVAGFVNLLQSVVEAERLVVAGLTPEMPCRKMHENRHRAFREALSMATSYFQPNAGDELRPPG